MNYDCYLGTKAWKTLRAAAIARDGGRCRLCDATDDLEVHHRYYPASYNCWDEDTLDALTTVCAYCHDAITCALRRRRYATAAHPALRDVKRIVPITEGVRHERLQVTALLDCVRITPAPP